MEMNLVLRFHIDDPASGSMRRFTKKVLARAPHVPRVGEHVRVPGATTAQHLGARCVDQVIYTLEDEVILQLSLDGLTNPVDSQVKVLTDSGFIEISEH
jgi:hypothetical protein